MTGQSATGTAAGSVIRPAIEPRVSCAGKDMAEATRRAISTKRGVIVKLPDLVETNQNEMFSSTLGASVSNINVILGDSGTGCRLWRLREVLTCDNVRFI